MEFLIVLGAFVVIDFLAIRYGTDSRSMNVDRDDTSAVRSGN